MLDKSPVPYKIATYAKKHVANIRHVLYRAYVFGAIKILLKKLPIDIFSILYKFFDFFPKYYIMEYKEEYWRINMMCSHVYNRNIYVTTFQDAISEMMIRQKSALIMRLNNLSPVEIPSTQEKAIFVHLNNLHRAAYHESTTYTLYMAQLRSEKTGKPVREFVERHPYAYSMPIDIEGVKYLSTHPECSKLINKEARDAYYYYNHIDEFEDHYASKP